MIVGSVLHDGDAVVPLQVRGSGGIIRDVLTVLDTGFNDWLSLSPSDINQLGLSASGEIRYTLADGSETVSHVFAVEVQWMGSWQRVLAIEMEGGPLLGIAMFRGLVLTIEVIDGGRVEVERYPAS